jgi:hypothetical protein
MNGVRAGSLKANSRRGRNRPRNPSAAAMRSSDLTPDQVRQIAARIQPLLGYLSRLEARMDREAFPVDDELLLLARRAQASVEALYMGLHYLKCDAVGHRRHS